jgi:16S rRNA (guanine527-N7)-methyltransferase
MDRLGILVSLVGKWQRAENLVSPTSLGAIWQRHVADSAQLVPLFPKANVWLDIGSGGGFPGLVVACLVADEPGRVVHLVESNERKCAFLRRAAAATGVPAVVHQGRAEHLADTWMPPPDVVTARAVAPLPALFRLVAPFMGPNGRAALHKGRDFDREIGEASQYWDFDLVRHTSRIDASSVILEVSRLVPRTIP